MADLPTGTVTFLFTDIAGSTQLWEQHPQAMPAALARHDALMRQMVEAHGGAVFKLVGDALCAAFATAADVLDAAVAAQRTLHAEPWGEIGALRVRMALHTGAAQQRDGDYFGQPLNRVARLLATGHGGQTLLSATTWELLRDQLPAGVELHDLGDHRLKDLARPEHIFQLVIPDLPATFPPLKTLDTHPTNLPAQPTALIGREQEVAAVCGTLRKPDVRLLTLTGPGGTGKTRLALQTAAELLDDFADGVYFVNLAPISDPALVLSAIVQTLGVRESGGKSLLDGLKDYLREKRLLLLLDNFEQVVAAAPLVAELLAAAPHLKVLVTSRAALRISGEREVAVPPLGLPPHPPTSPPSALRLSPTPGRGGAGNVGELTQYEAVRLFIERAQAVRADFAVTNENAPAVAEICYQLDGLPLAIELAAARIKLFPPQALLARLGNRLKLLTGGARDLPQRQQTIRGAIAWSYDLLNAGEQRLLARLGVFVGGWTLEAAEAVCNADGDLSVDVVDSIAALVDQSLVRQEEEVVGEPRFRMLETIREYALERLVANGEEAALRQQHGLYYLTLVETAEPLLRSMEQRVWLHRLKAEYDNLRAALAWSQVAANSAGLGLRLAAALWYFWVLTGYLGQGREYLRRVLAHAEATAPTVARARALFAAGHLAGTQGDFALARTYLAESQTLSRMIGYQQGVAYAWYGLGSVAWQQGEYATAREQHAESLTLFRELGERWPIALTLYSVANDELQGNDELHLDAYERVALLFEESLTLFRALGDQVRYGHAMLALGVVARLQGDYARAAVCLAECLAVFRELNYTWGMAATHLGLGYLALAQQDAPRAAACFAESLVRYRELGHKEGISQCLAGSAGAAGGLGQPARAARLFGTAEELRAVIGAIGQPERAAYERSVASVRAQLDPATFAAAWAEGRAMPLEQAIAYALEPPSEAQPPTPLEPPPPLPSITTYPAGLTAREVEVLRLLAQGLSYAQIAEQLVISPRTVNRHLTAIYTKLDVTSRHAAARFVTDHHLI